MPFNTALHILDTLDSTNLYAMQQIRDEMAEDGHAWLALEQTQGKGRLQRQWVMEKGCSLAMSLVINMTHKPIKEPFLLSMATALAAKKVIEHYLPSKVAIKWPNDIYVGHKKLAGILIENVWQAGKWQWAVIGIGINVLQKKFPNSLPNATSIVQHRMDEAAPNIITIAKQWLHEMVLQTTLLLEDAAEIAHQYNLALYKRNEMIDFKDASNTFRTGKLVAVVPGGQILINENGSKLFDLDAITIQI
jgi:BirA family transcriptional regulator, biotin operon repressor / biotin---[acetyl-CoA-carboxylase] ligase